MHQAYFSKAKVALWSQQWRNFARYGIFSTQWVMNADMCRAAENCAFCNRPAVGDRQLVIGTCVKPFFVLRPECLIVFRISGRSNLPNTENMCTRFSIPFVTRHFSTSPTYNSRLSRHQSLTVILSRLWDLIGGQLYMIFLNAFTTLGCMIVHISLTTLLSFTSQFIFHFVGHFIYDKSFLPAAFENDHYNQNLLSNPLRNHGDKKFGLSKITLMVKWKNRISQPRKQEKKLQHS